MRRFIVIALALGLAACHDMDPVSPDLEDPDLHLRRAPYGFYGGALRVMTRNVYVGADVDVILGAQDPSQIPLLVAQAYQQLIATNFPERADALAREIARAKPHLIGLQEISTIRIQSPGDAIIGGTVPAETVLFDYLEILMAALQRRGEHYTVVAKIQTTDYGRVITPVCGRRYCFRIGSGNR